MRVGFNILPLQSGHRVRGMGVYARNLLEQLKRNKDIEIVEFLDEKELRNIDLVHYPYFDLFFRSLPLKKKYPTVVTIPDVTPLVFPKHYPPGIRGNLRNKLQRFALKSVKAVITLSEWSKKDIVKYLNVKEGKIFPIYLAVSQMYKEISNKRLLEGVKKKYQFPEKFAIFVGNVNYNKNLINIAKACVKTDLDLYLIGKSFEDKDPAIHAELQYYGKFLQEFLGNSRIHFLGFVEDDELVKIYNLASVLVTPSFYEGFGLTILEAQACGCPVVTSNTSSLPEVAGAGALLVNPEKLEDITEAIYKIIDDKKFRDELIEKGLENVRRFSWEETAQKTIEVYRQVLSR